MSPHKHTCLSFMDAALVVFAESLSRPPPPPSPHRESPARPETLDVQEAAVILAGLCQSTSQRAAISSRTLALGDEPSAQTTPQRSQMVMASTYETRVNTEHFPKPSPFRKPRPYMSRSKYQRSPALRKYCDYGFQKIASNI